MEAMRSSLPEGSHGRMAVQRFTVAPDSWENARLAIREGRSTAPGTYTRLMLNGRLWMSDTDAECRDHLEPLWQMITFRARRVLINGLGLGCVVTGALTLDHVEHIDVVEHDPDVVALVGPHFTASGRVTIHEADAYAQARAWPRGTRWEVGWSDIWPDLCADHLPDMARLNRSYARRCTWHRCWGQSLIRAHAQSYGW